jgi:hypothetical protein
VTRAFAVWTSSPPELYGCLKAFWHNPCSSHRTQDTIKQHAACRITTTPYCVAFSPVTLHDKTLGWTRLRMVGRWWIMYRKGFGKKLWWPNFTRNTSWPSLEHGIRTGLFGVSIADETQFINAPVVQKTVPTGDSATLRAKSEQNP